MTKFKVNFLVNLIKGNHKRKYKIELKEYFTQKYLI